ncbi:haloacid dehalogenase-like hydrolase [Mycolicibacterium wolinskyi]|uniref:HAD family hydrolase n=1 Tax=Mycolicibacterium TaxID=1866885 RepID=UPI000A146C6D|nr:MULTISPECIES: HAD family hydrolase [Mycolicibacterium]MCV7287489.1 haloacid dehalogenase-like hydrolase [Mycolicibacterium wolinskyi]MCV7294387.1 haloacid dehalogenase-like hydrolase [Mycolicibacterium goodii]
MPVSLVTQTEIALIWDFDRTLTTGYMQKPLFEHFNVNEGHFWGEVNALRGFYEKHGLELADDTAYLEHTLNYVRNGRFRGLNNSLLRELGAQVDLAPGMPEFMQRTKDFIATNQRYVDNKIAVEHYVVSTGFRQMIEGNPIHAFLDGVWACELLPDAPSASDGKLDGSTFDPNGPLTQIGYTIDNTTKTRAIFEINKGINKLDGVNVNARMAADERRVPFQNMIYIADGPSDVPVFSVVGQNGGKTLAVYGDNNYDGVQQLQDEGRVNSTAPADYTVGSAADRWLFRWIERIADRICNDRDQRKGNFTNPAGHVTK